MTHARTIMGIQAGGPMNFSNLAKHDLGGDVTPAALEREANSAIRIHNQGIKAMMSGDLACAMDCFFKSAAIAVNVVFTVRTHDIAVPSELSSTMERLCSQATHGIKRVMKMIAMKKVMEHNELLHPGLAMKDMSLSSVVTPFTPVFMRESSPLRKRGLIPRGSPLRPGKPFIPSRPFRPEDAGQAFGPKLIPHDSPVELWSKLAENGIPLQDMWIVPGGVLVSWKLFNKASLISQNPSLGVVS